MGKKRTQTSKRLNAKKTTRHSPAGDKSSSQFTYPEEQLRLFIESVQDYAMIMLNPSGEIISWNVGAERMKGYTKNEIIGKHFSLLYTEEDVRNNKPQQLLNEANKAGRVEDEGWRVRKDGSLFWANVVITALRNSDHQLIGYSKVTRDLTERKETEQRLQEIINRSPSIIFVKDVEGRYIKVNSQFEKLFGFTANDVIGKTDNELFSKEQAEEFRVNDQKVLESGEPITFEEHARYIDGIHTSIVQKYPLRRLDGSLYGIGGIVTDITIIKKITTELLETTAKLQAIIQASPLAILTVNKEGEVTSWNKSAEHLFGWKEDETVGYRIKIVLQNDFDDYMTMVLRGINGESVSGIVRTLQKKNGTLVHASVSYAPIKNDSNTTDSIIFIIEDITERISAEEKLHESQQQLRQLTRELQQAREEERSYIAKEIDVEFGHLLNEIGSDLDWLHQNIQAQKITTVNEVLPELRTIKSKLNESLSMVRGIVRKLRPPALDYLGLIVAMELNIQEFEQSSKVRTSFITNISNVQLNSEQSIAVLNVMRESMSNIERHADASHAVVKFLKKNSHIVLIIEDDGRGMPSTVSDRATLSGISRMRDQARALKGELLIERNKPSGTIITLTIPLSDDAAINHSAH